MSFGRLLLVTAISCCLLLTRSVLSQTTVIVPTVPCVGMGCNMTTEPPTGVYSTTTESSSTIMRTVVFMKKETAVGQDVFIRGGISDAVRPECVSAPDVAETDPCAISIQTNSLGDGTAYAKYDAWRVNDTQLDWFGAQMSQGKYGAIGAQGTPLAWTTNANGAPEFQILNRYGPHHWMVDLDMDCSQTQDGWFELKAIVSTTSGGVGESESNIPPSTCSGTGAGTPPFTNSNNHVARCGFVNVFVFNTGPCEITAF